MRAVYIADDGKQFEDEYECERYEFQMSHPNLKTIEFYDEGGEFIDNYMDDEGYCACCKVVVHSNEELDDLHEMADYTGNSSYLDITDVGEWVYDDSIEEFRPDVKETFVQELSDKYVEKLKECCTLSFDPNKYADNTIIELLLDLGYKDVADAYRKAPKLYF